MDNEMNKMPEANNVKPAEQSAGLAVPKHEEVVLPKVEIEDPSTKSSTEVKIPQAPKGGIQVIATREGFFNQMRTKKGTKFIVPKIESLGEWMECIDPVMEKERIRQMNKKKANR